MDKKEFEKIKGKTPQDLVREAKEGREKLWAMRRDIVAGKQKDVRKARAMKKDIARILTVLNEKKG